MFTKQNKSKHKTKTTEPVISCTSHFSYLSIGIGLQRKIILIVMQENGQIGREVDVNLDLRIMFSFFFSIDHNNLSNFLKKQQI